MLPEVKAATAFLSEFLPVEVSFNFSASLESTLLKRFEGHWYQDEPERGSAYRSMSRRGDEMSLCLVEAAERIGFAVEQLRPSLASHSTRVWIGDRWTLWIDPGLVCLRIENEAPVNVCIYGEATSALQCIALASFNQKPHTQPLASLFMDTTAMSSPARRSKAVQILPPPSKIIPAHLVIPPTPAKREADVYTASARDLAASLPVPSPLARRDSTSSLASSGRSSPVLTSENEDSLFSSSESTSSTSSGRLSPQALPFEDDCYFKYPQLPRHRRTGSSTSQVSDRSVPSSPSKPRRRGTRGSGSSHKHSSSINSISSVSSSTSSQADPARHSIVTEHSGGKVGVLGGGVLLGMATGPSHSLSMRDYTYKMFETTRSEIEAASKPNKSQ